jgi:hypothetical protein
VWYAVATPRNVISALKQIGLRSVRDQEDRAPVTSVGLGAAWKPERGRTADKAKR